MQIRNLDPRAAAGLRPAGYYEPPARSSLTTGIAGESAARRRRRTPQWSAERRALFAKGAPPTRRQLVRLSALRSPRYREGEMRMQANPAPFKQYGRRSVG